MELEEPGEGSSVPFLFPFLGVLKMSVPGTSAAVTSLARFFVLSFLRPRVVSGGLGRDIAPLRALALLFCGSNSPRNLKKRLNICGF